MCSDSTLDFPRCCHALHPATTLDAFHLQHTGAPPPVHTPLLADNRPKGWKAMVHWGSGLRFLKNG